MMDRYGYAAGGVVGAVAVLAALRYLYQKFLEPLARTVVWIQEYLPVITDIAHEFKSNGGSTLKEQLAALVDGQTANKNGIAQLRQGQSENVIAHGEIQDGVDKLTADLASLRKLIQIEQRKIHKEKAAKTVAEKTTTTRKRR